MRVCLSSAKSIFANKKFRFIFCVTESRIFTIFSLSLSVADLDSFHATSHSLFTSVRCCVVVFSLSLVVLKIFIALSLLSVYAFDPVLFSISFFWICMYFSFHLVVKEEEMSMAQDGSISFLFFSFHLIAGCSRRRCFNNILYCVISFYGCAIIFSLLLCSSLALSLSLSRYTFICLNLTQFAFPLSYTRPLSFLFTRSLCVTPVFIALLLVHMQTTTHTTITRTIFFALFCFYFILLYFATTAWVYFGYFFWVCVWFVRFVSFVLYGGIVYTYLFVPFGIIIIGFLFVVCVAIFMST